MQQNEEHRLCNLTIRSRRRHCLYKMYKETSNDRKILILQLLAIDCHGVYMYIISSYCVICISSKSVEVISLYYTQTNAANAKMWYYFWNYSFLGDHSDFFVFSSLEHWPAWGTTPRRRAEMWTPKGEEKT